MEMSHNIIGDETRLSGRRPVLDQSCMGWTGSQFDRAWIFGLQFAGACAFVVVATLACAGFVGGG
jgi:hypothetical protein